MLSRVRRYPQLLDEVIAAGHEIGLHGVDHVQLSTFTPAAVERRTRDAKRELEDLIGRDVTWFRPPYGRQSIRIWRAITRCDLVPVSWGGAMLDWVDSAPADRIAAAMEGARPGCIVLAHDGFAGPDDGVHDGPPPAIDRGDLARTVLTMYAERGLAGRSITDALVEGTEVLRPWFRY